MVTTLDPIELIEHLDPNAIRARLDDLRRQEDALKVLLRAAVRRDREAAVKGELAKEVAQG